MALNDFVERKDRIIDVAESNFVKSIPDIQAALYERIQSWILTLDTKGGKLDTEQVILEKIAQLEDVINSELRASGYGGEVRNYLRNFDQIDKLNQDLHLDFNDIRVTPNQIGPVRERMVGVTVDTMAGNGLDANFKQPLKDIVRKNIVFGSTVSDTEEAVRGYILGDQERLGRLDRYAKQIARDSIQQYDGAVNNEIREVYGMDKVAYVGSLIQDSRPQCVRWVGQGTIAFEDLQQEIDWANTNGTGMIPGTTPSNFTIFRGGFNCRHEAIPTF